MSPVEALAVVLALGFGVFLVVTLWVVQDNVLRRFELDAAGRTPNLVAFDIQSDQRADVIAAFEALDLDAPELVPIVPARIAAIGGRPVEQLRADTASRREPWALRHEYRNTYRAALSGSEELVSGEWWDAPRATGSLPRISIEEDLARDLDVGLGDRITWDVQGVRIETRIASMRRVDWARFETNFFVVFEGGVLDAAPQNVVVLARIPDATERAKAQRDVVLAHPNVSLVDVATVQDTVERIIGRTTLVIRFMAAFSVIAGIVVLAGAVSASRFQRVRESVLLRTLGATRRQIRHILLTEYLALGTLAALAGATLATAAGWALIRFFFDMEFHLPAAALLAACAAAIILSIVIGLANSREAIRGTPLAVLREATE